MSDSHAHADTGEALSAHVRAEIDHWLAKFPVDRKRSAVIAALHAVQHEKGHLPQASMDAVAGYLGIPPIQVYEVASFYSMFETRPCGRHHISVCTNISCMLCGGEDILRTSKSASASRSAKALPTAASTSSRKKNALQPATARR